MKKLIALVLALTMALTFAACGSEPAETTGSTAAIGIPGVEDGVLTVGMECAYAPYNWTQMDDSNGAVPIANNPGSYANGYDVMIAQKICDAFGWKLEVMALECLVSSQLRGFRRPVCDAKRRGSPDIERDVDV